MPRALSLVLLALALLSACARVGRSGSDADLATARLQARIAARAKSWVGHKGAFRVGKERFPADCSGFVAAVYEAEGVPLRRLMQQTAPKERSGVAAAWRTVQKYGEILPPKAWPVPGDLVFWHDTWDRDRNGRRGDRLTHMGVVLWVDDDTITFVHRGSKAVQRGSMTVKRRSVRRDENGRELNTPLRFRDGKGGPVLAAELLAGYGRLHPSKLP